MFHLKYIWLFTFNDLKTIVVPETALGIITAISAPAFGIPVSAALSYSSILRRTPVVTFWVWVNLLPMTIDNQRRPSSILEDGLNKPWRPMPSNRLTPRQAKSLMLALYPIAVLTSFVFGGFRPCISLMLLGCWYNGFGGSDVSWISRNFLNACGFVCYAAGATEFLIIWAIVLTTVQTQDMGDQAADALRGRKTLPLVFGDSRSRTITCFPIALWSSGCPWYWQSAVLAYLPCLTPGAIIMLRTLTKRSAEDDNATWKLWNFWLVILYNLPLVKYMSME
ncbi:uncharacterized protein K444DRAFT_655319 [Hyaloscypha bicolor E]|uniref:UbiA prenyltransferase n=1 Tax=Hyaloscypha bicolor E TaxID=1095630 RepID=A0A2J6SWZ0_9HELO|nr:uncharacterized protein K444DRAFT_655319 [Hyaloscypha bicolor E]PMD55287.1 hypothetical protein K444DRAFT_655319 [Hyaloscypha bicolor E]